MRTKGRVLTIALSLLLCATWAQGGVLDKVKGELKKAVNEITSDETQPAPAGNDAAVSQSGTGGTKMAAMSGSHPALSTEKREYYPSLSFSTVLNGVKLHYKRGVFSLDNIQATFIPDNAEGYTILRAAAGEELFRYDWKTQPIEKPYNLLEIMGTFDLKTGEKLSGGGISVDLKKAGDYVLDFYLPTEHFYTFPFTVETIGSSDPFAGEAWWVLSGDWANWGYLYIPKADPEQNLYWKMWLRRKDKGTTSELHQDVKVRVTIRGPGGVVCVSRDATRSIGPDWVRWEYDMAYPSDGTTSWNEYFKAKNLLEKDGDYTLTVELDGNLYGTWKFSVAGGKFQYAGRTVRAQADPLTFVEGGRDAYWYCKEK